MGSANERVKGDSNNGSDQILSRRNMIRLLAFTVSVLVLAETSYAQERPPIFQQMFKTYGFESFGQVEKIRYTFNDSRIESFSQLGMGTKDGPDFLRS